jgi:hypothetical protein
MTNWILNIHPRYEWAGIQVVSHDNEEDQAKLRH